MGFFEIFKKKRQPKNNLGFPQNSSLPMSNVSAKQMYLKAQLLLEQASASADLANHTTNPKIFFQAYDDTLRSMAQLKELEQYVSFSGRSPGEILSELQSEEQRNAAVSSMIKRCVQIKRWRYRQQAEQELSPFWNEIPKVARNDISQLPDDKTAFPNHSKFDLQAYESKNNQQIKDFKQAFDLNSIEGIRSITCQAVQKWVETAPGVPSHPVEILSKQASAYKKEHLDLAIECLRKANELRPTSGMFYTEDTYLRLVRYLCMAERFEEANREYKKIRKMFHGKNAPYSRETLASASLNSSFSSAKQLGTDLVEVSWIGACCDKCGKYRGRIFSISGRDNRFPKFPSDFCVTCGLSVCPIVEGVSVPLYTGPEHLVEKSQYPLVDTRTPDEIQAYNEKCHRIQREQERRDQYIALEKKDREDYAWIRDNLPELIPKTFSGYRRMKTMNTLNYQKLRSKALELGREI